MLPERTVIDLLVDRTQMRQLVHQGLKAIPLRVPAYKNRLATLQRHSAYPPAKYVLDHGLANQENLPAVRHWLGPDAGPSFTRQLGDILAPDRSFETSHPKIVSGEQPYVAKTSAKKDFINCHERSSADLSCAIPDAPIDAAFESVNLSTILP
jgi:hypothetical protein